MASNAEVLAFIRARLDKDEQRARAADDAEVEFIGEEAADNGCRTSGKYIERLAPSRALRQIEAMRAVVDALEWFAPSVPLVLERIAAIWSGHRDYPFRPAPPTSEPVNVTLTFGSDFVLPSGWPWLRGRAGGDASAQ